MKLNRVSILSTLFPLALLGACTSSTASSTPTGGKGGSIVVTASAEAFGQNGFSHPTAVGDEPFFIDGWAIQFEEILVTFDHVTVSEGPDTSAGDQSQIGALVAKADGPWAVDLKKGGPLKGKGGDDTSIELTTIENQNQNGGAGFDEDTKYAFGYQTVKASSTATKVNFDGSNEADYAEMVSKGYVVYLKGVAEFVGTSCSPAIGSDAILDGLPKKVHFKFGFTKEATMVNCQNPDLGDTTDGENPRGIIIKNDEQTVAQLTLHTDHPFWDSREEDAPLRFDAIALAAATKSTDAEPTITFEDLVGIPFAPITAGGKTLPNRTCSPADALPLGDLSYDPKGAVFTDLHDFIADRQSTQAHLNADGLCYVVVK